MTQHEEKEALQQIRAAVALYGRDVKQYQNLGNIRAVLSPDGDYVLLNYTEEATYERTWSPVERVCRGLVLHIESTTIVALPFPKFFNLNEVEETRFDNLPNESFEVTTKMDGSCGIVWRDLEGRMRISTRGSFVSEQAEWAQRYWDEHYGPDRLPADTTLLFEIIYPENRVVLKYRPEEAGLYLIGGRLNNLGTDYSYSALAILAKASGFKTVPRHHILDLAGFVEVLPGLIGMEGVVIRFRNGLRVKLKTEEYVQLHKLISGLTPKRALDLLKQGGEAFHAYAIQLPDELQATARGYAAKINRVILAYFWVARERYQSILDLSDLPAVSRDAPDFEQQARARRKFVAQQIQTQVEPNLRPLVWALYDNKPIRQLLLKQIDLVRLFGPEAVEAETRLAEAA
jgi:RNA ligase